MFVIWLLILLSAALSLYVNALEFPVMYVLAGFGIIFVLAMLTADIVGVSGSAGSPIRGRLGEHIRNAYQISIMRSVTYLTSIVLVSEITTYFVRDPRMNLILLGAYLAISALPALRWIKAGISLKDLKVDPQAKPTKAGIASTAICWFIFLILSAYLVSGTLFVWYFYIAIAFSIFMFAYLFHSVGKRTPVNADVSK